MVISPGHQIALLGGGGHTHCMYELLLDWRLAIWNLKDQNKTHTHKGAHLCWLSTETPLFIPVGVFTQMEKQMRSLFSSGNDSRAGCLLSTLNAPLVSSNQHPQVLKRAPVLTKNKAGMKIITFFSVPSASSSSLAQEAASASPRLRGAVFHPWRWQPHSCHSCSARSPCLCASSTQDSFSHPPTLTSFLFSSAHSNFFFFLQLDLFSLTKEHSSTK